MKLYKYLVVAGLFIGMSSCSEDELEFDSTSKLPAENVFETEAGTEAALVGLYYSMAQPDDNDRGSFWACHIPMMGEIRGDDVIANNDCWYSTYKSIHQFNVQPSWGFITDFWNDAYATIEVANSIMEANMPFDEAKANNYKAQARAIRAMVYYDIIAVYGRPYADNNGANPGVCLVTKTDYSYAPARSTVKECYDLMVTDLTDAIKYLEPVNTALAVTMNKNMANGLLARVYMDMLGDSSDAVLLGKAKAAAEAAVDNVDLMTASEFSKGLSQTPSESLFTFSITEAAYSKWRSFTGFWDDWDGMGKDIRVTKERFDSFADNDIRKDFFWPEYFNYTSLAKWNDPTFWGYTGVPITDGRDLANFDINTEEYGNKYYMYGKFPRKDFVGDFTGKTTRGRTGLGNYTYMRASEMVLTIAECEARLGNDGAAAAQLLKIQNRAIADATLSANTGTTLVDEILEERRKELLGEGIRFRDIIRWKKDVIHAGVSHWDAKTVKYTDDHLLWPIPQDEINANSSLTEADQNPGY